MSRTRAPEGSYKFRKESPMSSLFPKSSEPDSAMPAPRADDEQRLIEAYVAIGRTLDDLPYTEDFERLIEQYRTPSLPEPDRRAVILTLQRLRKARKGGLPSVGRVASAPPKVTSDEESLLASLVTGAVGSLGSRDSLLYDPRFDAIVETFNFKTSKTVSRHDVWRLVAKLAK